MKIYNIKYKIIKIIKYELWNLYIIPNNNWVFELFEKVQKNIQIFQISESILACLVFL